MFFTNPSLLVAIAASFIAGVLGYIIARLWVKPIVGYNITKRKLDDELKRYLSSIDTENGIRQNDKNGEAALQAARQDAMKLLSYYNADIPYWYRLLLDSRRESPAQASGLLTNLNKIKDLTKRQARIEAARKELKLHEKETT